MVVVSQEDNITRRYRLFLKNIVLFISFVWPDSFSKNVFSGEIKRFGRELSNVSTSIIRKMVLLFGFLKTLSVCSFLSPGFQHNFLLAPRLDA